MTPLQPPDERPPKIGRRAAAAVVRQVDMLFSAEGPAFRQLAASWAGNVAGDTLVAVALAGTLFFQVPAGEARGNVALYLVLTLAPFAVIAPLLGGIFARFPAYRFALVLSSVARAVLAVLMMFATETLWLYPLAFGLLVLSRLYGISKASLLPVAVPQRLALVSANARLARIAIMVGALVVAVGVGAERVAGNWLVLILAAAAFVWAGFVGLGVPTPPAATAADAGDSRYRGVPRRVRLSTLATAGVRLINGFLLLLLAFAFRDADAGATEFGTMIAAAGLGFGLAAVISPWLERRLREEPMVVAALAIEAASAFIAAQGFGLPAAAALAAAAGLAWGTAKFAFDGLLQSAVRPEVRGAAFTRAETLFQLAWVIGAILPVTLPIPAELGLALAGVAALGAQTVFVSGLLVSYRKET